MDESKTAAESPIEVTPVPPQAQFDQDLLTQNLHNARMAYAGAKLAVRATRDGIETADGLDYNAHLKRLTGARRTVEYAELLIAETDGGELPEPVAKLLTIAKQIPSNHPSGQGPNT